MGQPHPRLPRIGSKLPLRNFLQLGAAKRCQNSRRLRFEPLENRHLLSGAPGTIDEFGAAQGAPLASAANGIAYQFGRLWFTEQSQPGISGAFNNIGNIVTDGSETAATEIPILDNGGNPVNNAFANGIAIGPHGSVWFAEGRGDVTKYDPGAGSFTDYAISGGHPTSIAAVFNQDLLDFVMVFTDQGNNTIGRILPDGTVDPHPSTIPTAGAHPFDITEGPDGNAWFTELFGNKIGRVNADGSITEFPLPHADSSPEGIAAGPDGSLWFTEQNRATIGRITPAGQIKEYPFFGVIDQPSAIVTGLNGNLWFTETTTDPNTQAAIGRIWQINARTGQLSGPYLIPTAGTLPGDIALGSDLNVWFTESKFTFDPMNPFGGTYTGHIGRFNVPANTLPPVDVGFTTIQATPSPAKIGEPVTFTITVKNSTPDAAKNVIVYNPIPANLTVNSITSSQGSATQINGQIAIDVGDLAGNASATIQLTVTATAPGDITDRAYLVTDSPDGNGSNNSTEKTVTVQPNTSTLVLGGFLVGDLTGNPMTYNAATGGTTGTFKWQLTDVGGDPPQNPVVTVTIPKTLGLTNIQAFPPNIFSSTTDANGNITITYTWPTDPNSTDPNALKVGKTQAFGFTAKPTALGNPSVTATLTAASQLTQGSKTSAVINTTVDQQKASLSLDGKLIAGVNGLMRFDDTTNPPTVTSGLFTWVLQNTGATTATNVTATVYLSSQLAFIPGSAVSSGTASYSASNHTLTFTLPSIAAGKSASFGFAANPTSSGPAYATADVSIAQTLVGGGSLSNTIATGVLSGTAHEVTLDPTAINPVIEKVNIVPIFYGSQWTAANAPAELKALPAQMHAAMKSIIDGPYMDFLSQYSTSQHTIEHGSIEDQDIFESDLPGTQPGTINDSGPFLSNSFFALHPYDPTQAQLFKIIDNEFPALFPSTLGIPSGEQELNNLYVVFAPPGTTVHRDVTNGITPLLSATSDTDFAAYHFYFDSLLDLFPTTASYIVLPYPSAPNLYPFGRTTLQALTLEFSHELAEAVTNAPGLIDGWIDRSHGIPSQLQNVLEIGDIEALIGSTPLPEGLSNYYGTLDGNLVQYLWANTYTYPLSGATVNDQPVLPVDPLAQALYLKKFYDPLKKSPGQSLVQDSGGEPGPYDFSGLIGSFDDSSNPGADPAIYQVTIDWGDNSTSAGIVAYDPNLKQFLVSGSHTFMAAAGTRQTISISLLDTANGDLAKLTGEVTLNETSANAANMLFDQAAYDAYRNGSDAVITVDRVGDATLEATVDYHISGGTAVDGVDYQSLAGTLDFPAGATTATILLPIFSNPSAAGDLTVNLALSNATGNTVLGTQAATVVTIHPSTDIFAPAAPLLDPHSDTGLQVNDGITADNGSSASPLTFHVTGASVRNGFVQLLDMTDPDNPALVGDPVQVSNGSATITLDATSITDGTHQMGVTNFVSLGTRASHASSTVQITIDSVAPTSQIAALPARTSLTSLPVSWSGGDNTGGAGVQAYNISVSVDGAAATPWLAQTTLTSATFAATLGHAYAFFASAIDLAGNTEPDHAIADATVVVTPKPWQNPRNWLDVNDDTHIASNDIVAVVNYINGFGPGLLPASYPSSQVFLDVNGDGFVAPNDIVQIVNHINAGLGDGESQQTIASNQEMVSQETLSAELLALLAADPAIQTPRRKR